MGLKLPVKLIHVLNLSISPQPVTPTLEVNMQKVDPSLSKTQSQQGTNLDDGPAMSRHRIQVQKADNTINFERTIGQRKNQLPIILGCVCVCVSMQYIPQVIWPFSLGDFPIFSNPTRDQEHPTLGSRLFQHDSFHRLRDLFGCRTSSPGRTTHGSIVWIHCGG